MLNFGASKPRVKGGPRPPGPPLDPHLVSYENPVVQVKVQIVQIRAQYPNYYMWLVASLLLWTSTREVV